jgi:outer membrane protein
MKKTGLLLMLFMCVNIMFAQKFGHINSLELLQKMPDVMSAEKELEAHGRKLQTQIQNMYLEYEKKVTEFKNQESELIPAVKEMQLKEIQDIQQRLQVAEQSAQQDLLKKKETLYAPILKKVEEAIKLVAKESSYRYVFDTSAGSVLYAEDADDISTLVKKKLNLN